MMFEITYIGMDQREHTETHKGDSASLAKHVTFLEERGAQSINTEEVGE